MTAGPLPVPPRTSMTTTVYIVMGRVGDHSDVREWPVIVMRDQARAEKLAADAQAHAAPLAADGEFRERVGRVLPADDPELALLARFDPTLVYTIGPGPNEGKRSAWWWTYGDAGPTYWVELCEMDAQCVDVGEP